MSVEQLQEAQQTADASSSVQNLYNLANRTAEPLLDHCEARASASSRGSRWRPASWHAPAARWQQLAEELDAHPSQLALAWLLRRSPVMLPIPGTSSVAHLEDNLAAAAIELTDEQAERLSRAGS